MQREICSPESVEVLLHEGPQRFIALQTLHPSGKKLIDTGYKQRIMFTSPCAQSIERGPAADVRSKASESSFRGDSQANTMIVEVATSGLQ